MLSVQSVSVTAGRTMGQVTAGRTTGQVTAGRTTGQVTAGLAASQDVSTFVVRVGLWAMVQRCWAGCGLEFGKICEAGRAAVELQYAGLVMAHITTQRRASVLPTCIVVFHSKAGLQRVSHF